MYTHIYTHRETYMRAYIYIAIQQAGEVHVHYTFQLQLLKWHMGDNSAENRQLPCFLDL